MKQTYKTILQFVMIKTILSLYTLPASLSSDGSSNVAKLDDEETKSATMNAKKLCEDIGETAMGQRDMVMVWG